MQKDLRFFLNQLKSAERFIRITKEVDAKLEISALMRGAEKIGKAIFFEKVKRSKFPVINNVLGTREVLGLLFETAPENVVKEWIARVEKRTKPRIVSSSPVKDVVKKNPGVNLENLPIVIHSSKDIGPYITGGIVVAKDPETGVRNVSINRMQLKGKAKLGIRMMPPQHLGVIREKYAKQGKDLEIAVAIGNHPFEMLAAATTTAYGVDEFEISGALRKEPLELVKCETVDHEVPATAEIVLEGVVPVAMREPEGPFGDFMQYYIPVMENFVFEVKAITHRRDAIYQTIQASSAEDIHLLALSREAQIYEAVSKVAEVLSVCLGPTIMNCMISIKKRSEEEPKNVVAAAFGVYPWLKYCVVVDHDVNVFDANDVWWAMATRSRPDKGLLLVENAPGFPRDPYYIHQSKLGIDATAPLNQWKEFERKSVIGLDSIRLDDYL